MDKVFLATLKGKSREERAELFNDNKAHLFSDGNVYLSQHDLDSVNGGQLADAENPDSDECPYNGNWITSFGYVCNGEVIC